MAPWMYAFLEILTFRVLSQTLVMIKLQNWNDIWPSFLSNLHLWNPQRSERLSDRCLDRIHQRWPNRLSERRKSLLQSIHDPQNRLARSERDLSRASQRMTFCQSSHSSKRRIWVRALITWTAINSIRLFKSFRVLCQISMGYVFAILITLWKWLLCSNSFFFFYYHL